MTKKKGRIQADQSLMNQGRIKPMMMLPNSLGSMSFNITSSLRLATLIVVKTVADLGFVIQHHNMTANPQGTYVTDMEFCSSPASTLICVIPESREYRIDYASSC